MLMQWVGRKKSKSVLVKYVEVCSLSKLYKFQTLSLSSLSIFRHPCHQKERGHLQPVSHGKRQSDRSDKYLNSQLPCIPCNFRPKLCRLMTCDCWSKSYILHVCTNSIKTLRKASYSLCSSLHFLRGKSVHYQNFWSGIQIKLPYFRESRFTVNN